MESQQQHMHPDTPRHHPRSRRDASIDAAHGATHQQVTRIQPLCARATNGVHGLTALAPRKAG